MLQEAQDMDKELTVAGHFAFKWSFQGQITWSISFKNLFHHSEESKLALAWAPEWSQDTIIQDGLPQRGLVKFKESLQFGLNLARSTTYQFDRSWKTNDMELKQFKGDTHTYQIEANGNIAKLLQLATLAPALWEIARG